MKENLSKVLEKVKGFLGKIKEQLKKIDVLNKVVALAKSNRTVLSIIFFCIAILTLILIATLGWGEFVVPVCVLMVLEVTMAVLLHRTEIWIHGVLLALHIIVGIIIARVPLTILCMVAYVITTLTQQMAFERVSESTEKVEETEKKVVSHKSTKKKNKK